VQLDGADFNNPFFGQASGQPESKQFVIAQEAVQEFQVMANGFSAEFGRSGGGVLNVVTKSGTNSLNGSGFYFGRNEALKGTLTTFDGEEISNSDFSQHQFGGSVGGPISTDKAHYFLAFEQQLFKSPFTVKFDRDTGPISNVALFGQEIAGVDRIADLEGTFSREINLTAILGKVDVQINDSNSLSVRYNYSRFRGINFGASAGGVEGTVQDSAEGTTEDTTDRAHSLVISNTTVIGTNKFNELRFQYAFEDRPRLGTVNDIPNVEIRDCCSWGRQGFLPITSNHTRFQIFDNFTYLFASHDLKVGFDLNFTNTSQTFVGFSGGEYEYNTLEDYIASVNDNTFIRSFRQRVGLNGFTTVQSGTIDFWQNTIAFYVQDVWRPSPGLTLNLGLRWTGTNNPTPPVEEFGLQARNPDNPGAVFGLDQQTIPDDFKQWAPRFYFAWDPQDDGRQVLRGGAGIFYAHSPALLMANVITNNGYRQGVLDIRGGFPPFLNLPFTFPETGIPPGDPILDRLPAFDIDFFSPTFRNPQVQRANVGYEIEVRPNFSVGIDYVYAHSIRQQRRRDINLDNPTEVDELGRGIFNAADRPDPTYRRFAFAESSANGRYQALVFQLKKRATGNVLFQFFYTYSVNKSEDDNERSATGINPSQPELLSADWGNSDRDVRNRVVGNVVFDFPADFRVSAGVAYNTGDPYNVTSGFDDNFDGRFNDRAVINDSNRQQVIDAGLDLADGLQERNTARNPRFFKIDVRITKAFTFGGDQSLDLMLDLFNLTNDANRRSGNGNISRSNFGLQDTVGESFQAQIGVRYRF
jgi:hypothetical protein